MRKDIPLDKLKHISNLQHDLDKELAKIEEPSYETPCQITDRPGIRLKVGAGTLPAILSPEMWDEYDKRIRDTAVLANAQKSLDDMHVFKNKHRLNDSVGKPEVLGEWLDLLHSNAHWRLSTGRAAIKILEEMKDEFGNSEVSS